MVRHVMDAHTAPLPAILEIPSKVRHLLTKAYLPIEIFFCSFNTVRILAQSLMTGSKGYIYVVVNGIYPLIFNQIWRYICRIIKGYDKAALSRGLFCNA